METCPKRRITHSSQVNGYTTAQYAWDPYNHVINKLDVSGQYKIMVDI